MANNLSLLIKPSSGICNMRCRYCFYDDVSNNREEKSYGFMSETTAERIIASAFDYIGNSGGVSFAFQGGEPTLSGIDFFEKFTETVEKYKSRRNSVSYSIQTNGYIIDEKWAELFQKHGFMVGISIDGYKSLHDRYREDAFGNGTYDKAVSAFRLLKKYGVMVNILTVVTKQCAKNPAKVYDELKKIGCDYMQFIPCLDPIAEKRGTFMYSLSCDEYGSFLNAVFRKWYSDWENGNYTGLRLFEDYIYILTGRSPGTCASAGRCGGYVVFESNGNMYPCDFYVLDEYMMGNITDVSISDALKGKVEQDFVSERETVLDSCVQCRWYSICKGGCKRDWTEKDSYKENYYCSAFKSFFEKNINDIMHIAQCELRALSNSRN